MNWFLCLLVIGLGLFSYNESQTIDELTAKLKESDQSVTSLKAQVLQMGAQLRAVSAAPATQAGQSPPASSNSWMWQRSILDSKAPPPGRK